MQQVINSKQASPGLLTSPVVCDIVGMTARQLGYWAAVCTPTIDVPADVGKGGAGTRRWSPHDVLRLRLVRECLGIVDPQALRSVISQVWSRVNAAEVPTTLWVTFDPPALHMVSETVPRKGPVLSIPTRSAVTAFNEAYLRAAPTPDDDETETETETEVDLMAALGASLVDAKERRTGGK